MDVQHQTDDQDHEVWSYMIQDHDKSYLNLLRVIKSNQRQS